MQSLFINKFKELCKHVTDQRSLGSLTDLKLLASTVSREGEWGK